MQALRTDWKVSNRDKSRPDTASPPTQPPPPVYSTGDSTGEITSRESSLRFYVRCSATQQSRETASGLTFYRAEAQSGMTKVSLLRSRH